MLDPAGPTGREQGVGWEFFIDDAQPAGDSDTPDPIGPTIPGVAAQSSPATPQTGAVDYPLLDPQPVSRSGSPAPRAAILIGAAGAAVLVVALLGLFVVRFVAAKSDDGVSQAGNNSGSVSSNWTVDGSPNSPSTDHTSGPQGAGRNADGAGPITFEGMRDFVYRHYADLPADPRATWDRLDSQFTARMTWSDYASFWATIQSVSVTSVQPDGSDSVIARLTLVPYRGSASTEQRRIKFVSTGGTLLISRTDRLG